MKNPALDAILGCRIRTHYNTGGVVQSYSGPYEGNVYTVVYRHERGGPCCLNTIRVENGIVTCEHVPLQVLDVAENAQMSLF